MKTEQIDKITEIAKAAIESFDGFLVDVSIKGEGGTSIVQVFVDTDQGVTADQCAAVSRTIASDLDRLNAIPGRFRLEVSSPGLDRPLTLPRQFRKNVGRQLRIVSNVDDARAEVSGILQEVGASSLTLLTPDQGAASIPLDRIEEAYVLPQFNKKG